MNEIKNQFLERKYKFKLFRLFSDLDYENQQFCIHDGTNASHAKDIYPGQHKFTTEHIITFLRFLKNKLINESSAIDRLCEHGPTIRSRFKMNKCYVCGRCME